jgi:PHD/YefM family antitoxin component YafN of YafNO toxin-antitoxin module
MKVISLSEARERLDEYGRLCQDEPVIVAVNGVPQFQLTPLDDDAEFMDRLLETNAEFRELCAARQQDRSLTADDALRALN